MEGSPVGGQMDDPEGLIDQEQMQMQQQEMEGLVDGQMDEA